MEIFTNILPGIYTTAAYIINFLRVFSIRFVDDTHPPPPPYFCCARIIFLDLPNLVKNVMDHMYIIIILYWFNILIPQKIQAESFVSFKTSSPSLSLHFLCPSQSTITEKMATGTFTQDTLLMSIENY